MKSYAVVLAAGSGHRMGTAVKKQYLPIKGRPLLYYSLKAFEDSFMDGIVIVTSKEDIDFVKEKIVKEYGFSKVIDIVEGGAQRCDSVLCGLKAIDAKTYGTADYVFIHDGARPLIDEAMLKRALDSAAENRACVVGMPSKDTVKIADDDGFVKTTPRRDRVWTVQTPQVFEFELIFEAYTDVLSHKKEYEEQGITITDDAMVLELYSDIPIKLTEGSYRNIKVTTPEDLALAEAFLELQT